MTDTEIKKALEICMGKRPLEDCEECPNYKSESRCKVMLTEVALDLINRQQAEVEKQSQNFKVLVSDHRTLQQSFDNLKGLYEDEKSKVEKAKEKSIYFAKELQAAKAEVERLRPYGTQVEVSKKIESEIKAEAIKAFIKRLKEKAEYHENGEGWEGDIYYADDVDNLVKEMVGDAE